MKKYYENFPLSVLPRDFTVSEIQSYTGVSLRSARRYRRDNHAPEPVLMILRYVAAGWLMPHSLKQFVRWSGHNLYVDGAGYLDIDDLRGWWITSQQLYHEVLSLRARVDRLQRLEVIRGAAQRGGLRLLEKPAPKHGSEVAQPAPYYRGSDPIRWRSGA